MKKFILFALIYAFANSDVFAQANMRDTTSLRMKLIAIDPYMNFVIGSGEKTFLLLLEVSPKDRLTLGLDSSYCKNRIVAEYDSFKIDDLVEGEYYNFKFEINKPQYSKRFWKKQKKAMGSPTNCIEMNLNKRWDRQYWISEVVR